jgi:preprotein translocase subunit SecD
VQKWAFVWFALVAIGLTACLGVETYRERSPARTLAIRMVAREGQAGESLPRFGSGAGRIEVARAVVVDSDHIRHVRLLEAADGQRIIVLDVDDFGRARLSEASRANIGGQMAIVVEGRVVAAPTIRNPLTENEVHVLVSPDEIDRAFAAIDRDGSP